MRKKLSAKQVGELAEARFLARATALGFKVAKPFGDSRSYDLIVEGCRGLVRVEVKSACAALEKRNGYMVTTSYQRLGRGYSLAEADFLAAHVPPVDAWYIIPVERLHKVTGIRLYPHRATTRSPWEEFREAWDLMETEKTKLG
jgi:hypothetical protein